MCPRTTLQASVLLALLLACTTAVGQGPQAAQAAQAAGTAAVSIDQPPALSPDITRRELEAHVRFLASDDLRGRATGSPESLRAAHYLADVLRASGIAPAGDDKSFLQRVPLEHVRPTAVPELLVTPVSGPAFQAQYGVDFEWPSGTPLETAALRIVIVRNSGELPKEPDAGAALFIDASTSDRRGMLTRRNAAGASGWGLLVAPGSEKPGQGAGELAPRWSPLQLKSGARMRDVWLKLDGPLLERLRKRELATLQFTTHVQREDVEAVNVVGILRGADEKQAGEAVVISAHYDHLGARDKDDQAAAPGVDRIFNGADDDASGCAAVLELAGRLAKDGSKRTVVFLLDTGEEVGLLGTQAYLEHPCVPLANTVANLNFEMIGRPDEKVGGAGVLWLTGYELSNLGAACKQAGLAIMADPRPSEHFFERSDNIAFVHRGIVGQTFSTYNLHQDYHEVSDEAATLDYAHMETCVRAGYAAVKLVTDGTLRPAWLEGKDPNAGRAPR